MIQNEQIRKYKNDNATAGPIRLNIFLQVLGLNRDVCVSFSFFEMLSLRNLANDLSLYHSLEVYVIGFFSHLTHVLCNSILFLQ